MDELDGRDVVRLHSATVRIGACSALPDWAQEHALEMSHLHVPTEDRRKGYASALVKLVCEQADAVNKTLVLQVKPYDGIDMAKEALRAWYGRFGFIEIQEEPCLLARMPGSQARALH